MAAQAAGAQAFGTQPAPSGAGTPGTQAFGTQPAPSGAGIPGAGTPGAGTPEAGAPAEFAPATSVGNPWRIIPIGANLLPTEIIESRRMRTVRWVVVTSLLVFVALLAAWDARATIITDEAHDNLAAAQERVQHLQQQKKQYDEVVKVRKDSKTITTRLQSLFGPDLAWAKLITDTEAAAPPNVTLASLVGAVNPDKAPDAKAGQLPSTSSEKTIGTLSLIGYGPDKPTIAAYVEALVKVPGLANPQLSDVTQDSGSYRFSLRLDVTASRLGGRFTPSPAPSASPAAGSASSGPSGANPSAANPSGTGPSSTGGGK